MTATWLGTAEALAYPAIGALIYHLGWRAGRRDKDGSR